MLGAPVWGALYAVRYPWRPEAIVLSAGAALAGAAIAVAGRRGGRWLGTLSFGGLLFVFADLQLAPETWADLKLIVPLCIVLSAILAANRAFITAMALGAFYLTALWRPPIAAAPRLATTSVARAENPVIVHIILDTQWGIGALRAAGDTVTADFLREFYLQRQFQVYEGTYSRFWLTKASVPNLLSLGMGQPVSRRPAKVEYAPNLSQIPYFTWLRAHGYDIHVLQTTFLDLCKTGEVSSCTSEPFNSLRNIGALDGPWTERAEWVVRHLLQQQSRTYRRLQGPPDMGKHSVAGAGIASLRDLDDRISALAFDGEPNGGHAFVAHLMLPHLPADVDSTCQILKDASRRVPFGFRKPQSDKNWREAMQTVDGQFRCAHKMLAETLELIDETIGRDKSIVIIHGDHGLRVLRDHELSNRIEDYTRTELNAAYPTLFAIRRPGLPPKAITGAIPVQDLFWDLALSSFAGPTRTHWEHFVARYPVEVGATTQIRPLSPSDMLWAIPADSAARDSASRAPGN